MPQNAVMSCESQSVDFCSLGTAIIFRNHVMHERSAANIIHINFNLPDYDDLLTSRSLYTYVREHYRENTENFVMIDEIQMCRDFEKAIKETMLRPEDKVVK